jgi:hypothetical protein
MLDTTISISMAAVYGLIGIVAVLNTIYSKGFNRVLAMILIALVGFSGIIVAEIPKHIMGWSTTQPLQDRCYIYDAIFIEPYPGNPGAIYILAFIESEPRLHKLPYSRKVHKELLRKLQSARAGGGLLQFQEKKVGAGQEDQRDGEEDDSNFKLINPTEELTKP